jgi:hypothetical protein
MPPVELKSLVQEIVDRITVAADRIEIQLSRAKIAAALQVGERSQRPDPSYPVDRPRPASGLPWPFKPELNQLKTGGGPYIERPIYSERDI